MAGKPPIILHFGTYLESTQNQLLYYDSSTATTSYFTIPEGVYFFAHNDTDKSIVSVINALITPAYPSFCLSAMNDRQIELELDDVGDYLRLVSTTNGDSDKLARLLGLYTSTGDLTYYQTHNNPSNFFTTLTSFFSESGMMYETYDLSGFPVWNSEYSLTESGDVAVISSSRKQEITLQFTCLIGFDFRGISDYPTGGYSTWSNSFWSAYDPVYQVPEIYIVASTDIDYLLHSVLLKPVMKENVKPVKQGYNGLFDLTLELMIKARYEV